jgi:DNA-binding response OmpR family regulator
VRLRAASGTETVLLVEDDSGVREATQRALRAAGYRVLSAPGAEGALEAVRTGGTPPALLMTDVIMPAVSGPDLAARLRAEHPAMRVLYLSGYAHGIIGAHGVLDPRVAFLPKPFTPRSLLARVREVLDAP